MFQSGEGPTEMGLEGCALTSWPCVWAAFHKYFHSGQWYEHAELSCISPLAKWLLQTWEVQDNWMFKLMSVTLLSNSLRHSGSKHKAKMPAFSSFPLLLLSLQNSSSPISHWHGRLREMCRQHLKSNSLSHSTAMNQLTWHSSSPRTC